MRNRNNRDKLLRIDEVVKSIAFKYQLMENVNK